MEAVERGGQLALNIEHLANHLLGDRQIPLRSGVGGGSWAIGLPIAMRPGSRMASAGRGWEDPAACEAGGTQQNRPHLGRGRFVHYGSVREAAMRVTNIAAIKVGCPCQNFLRPGDSAAPTCQVDAIVNDVRR
jgi:hypothetical protein